MCGGCIGGENSCRNSRKCYRYIPEEDTWVDTSGTMKSISGTASDYTDSMGLVIAFQGTPLEVTRDGISFQELADYPNPEVSSASVDGGCLVVVDETNIFLAGGFPPSNRTFMYNSDSNSWRELTNMAMKRFLHSCGLIDRYNNGTGKEIIVAGGREINNAVSTTSVEIFSIDTEEWREGTMLPYTLSGAYRVNIEESFI